MRQIPLILAIAAVSLTAASAKKQRTTRRPLQSDNIVTAIRRDSVVPLLAADIKLAGYDKPLRARSETIFATNASPDSLSIKSIRLTITYRDSRGRQLHRRSVWIETDLPPGQTRRLSFPSWDTQQSFYYRLSRQPRSAATPYDVTAVADSASITISRN